MSKDLLDKDSILLKLPNGLRQRKNNQRNVNNLIQVRECRANKFPSKETVDSKNQVKQVDKGKTNDQAKELQVRTNLFFLRE